MTDYAREIHLLNHMAAYAGLHPSPQRPKEYSVFRHYRDKRPKELVRAHRTLEEVQAHCHADDTQTEDWYDQWEEDNRNLFDILAFSTLNKDAFEKYEPELWMTLQSLNHSVQDEYWRNK